MQSSQQGISKLVSLHFSIVISLFPVPNLLIMPEQLRSASLYQHQSWHMKCVLWFLIFWGLQLHNVKGDSHSGTVTFCEAELKS